MAEPTTETDPKPEGEAPKKRFPMKMLVALGGVLAMEVVTVVIAFSLAGGPKAANADHGTAHPVADDGQKEAEELVIEDRFANSRRGAVYLYNTEVFVVVRKKNQEKVKAELKTMAASIRSDIATIFRRADPSFMHEDDLQTLSRQIKAALDERFGTDTKGEPIVLRVLMTRCTEYRVDF